MTAGDALKEEKAKLVFLIIPYATKLVII